MNPNSRLGTSPHRGGWVMDVATTADRFVGIDVSKARVDVHVRPEGMAFGCATDPEGLGALVARLQPLSPCLIVLEASGDLLVTERAGRLRILRNGVLDPASISGLPPMHVRGLAGLLDVRVHDPIADPQLASTQHGIVLSKHPERILMEVERGARAA
jgi:hypothetical protein